MTVLRSLLLPLCLLTATASTGWAQRTAPRATSSAAAWEQIKALDAGPQVKFRTREEARTGSLTHLRKQEAVIRAFLAAYPSDEKAFEAKLRLARLLQLRAGLEENEAPRHEARRLLDELYETTSGAQRVEVDFARLAFLMRTLRMSDQAQREQLLSATQRFKTEYPQDRRLAALLAEIAGLFDLEPETKRSLLQDAQRFSTDAGLKQRLEDDLRRLDLLGKPLPLKFSSRAGKTIDIADYRGKVVLLIFFAEFSPPSTDALALLQRTSAQWPKGAVQFLGISLDSSVDDLTNLIQRQNISWPVIFDGKGWGTPAARAFGINRLPTVWLIDQDGILRSLNAMEGTTEQIHRLLRGR